VMFTRTLAEPPPADDLYSALRQMLHSPLRTIVPPWSWKAATFSAVLRAATFFWSNLSSGREEAFRAMLLEAAYAVFAAGLVGAVSQRLRGSRPVWITCVIVWLCLPGIMVALQLVLHRLAHTPHVGWDRHFLLFLGDHIRFQLVCHAARHHAGRGGEHDV